MRFFRALGEAEIIKLCLDPQDTLEEMAAQAPMRMDELAAKIEDIIQDRADNEDLEAVREGAVEGYKRCLAIKLRSWAIEERDLEKYAHRKSHALLEDIARKIENGEL